MSTAPHDQSLSTHMRNFGNVLDLNQNTNSLLHLLQFSSVLTLAQMDQVGVRRPMTLPGALFLLFKSPKTLPPSVPRSAMSNSPVLGYVGPTQRKNKQAMTLVLRSVLVEHIFHFPRLCGFSTRPAVAHNPAVAQALQFSSQQLAISGPSFVSPRRGSREAFQQEAFKPGCPASTVISNIKILLLKMLFQ